MQVSTTTDPLPFWYRLTVSDTKVTMEVGDQFTVRKGSPFPATPEGAAKQVAMSLLHRSLSMLEVDPAMHTLVENMVLGGQ
jgi:hypothetical protein